MLVSTSPKLSGEGRLIFVVEATDDEGTPLVRRTTRRVVFELLLTVTMGPFAHKSARFPKLIPIVRKPESWNKQLQADMRCQVALCLYRRHTTESAERLALKLVWDRYAVLL